MAFCVKLLKYHEAKVNITKLKTKKMKDVSNNDFPINYSLITMLNSFMGI